MEAEGVYALWIEGAFLSRKLRPQRRSVKKIAGFFVKNGRPVQTSGASAFLPFRKRS